MKIRGQLAHKLAEQFPNVEFKFIPDGRVKARCHCYRPAGGGAILRSSVMADTMNEAIDWASAHECTLYRTPEDAYRVMRRD